MAFGIRCSHCRGAKKIRADGFMLMDCHVCLGKGFTNIVEDDDINRVASAIVSKTDAPKKEIQEPEVIPVQEDSEPVKRVHFDERKFVPVAETDPDAECIELVDHEKVQAKRPKAKVAPKQGKTPANSATKIATKLMGKVRKSKDA